MERITMVEFRSRSGLILRRLARGETLILTHRGRAVARLEPLNAGPEQLRPDDPIYNLDDYSFDGPDTPLSNSEIDRLIYGS